MDWVSLFSASEKQLQLELEKARAAVEHRGLKGTVNENTLSEWLVQHMPGHLDVCTGEVIDSDGNRSKQSDVILFDKEKTPRVFSSRDISIIPIETVYGIFEVKTYLNKNELDNSFQNMKSFKNLSKKSYKKKSGKTFKQYNLMSDFWPPQFYIFAYEGDTLEGLSEHLNSIQDNEHIAKRIDGIIILNRGLIMHRGADGVRPIPMPGDKMCNIKTENKLLTFYTLMMEMFAEATTDPINIINYTSNNGSIGDITDVGEKIRS